MANVYSSKATRVVKIGTTAIGGGNPILLQTMAASRTSDIDATVETVNRLEKAGAGLVRIAVDHQKDVEAVKEIRSQTTANLSVDLQENYRLAEKVAPFVDKIRYNPGHLHHMETSIPWKEKVRYLASVAEENDVALIKIDATGLSPVTIGSINDTKVGETVYAIGYPGVSQYNQDYVTLDADDATFTQGVVGKKTNSVYTKGTFYEIDAMLNHGNSGGPVVDEHGNAIGIIELMTQENALTLDEEGNVVFVPVSDDLAYAFSSDDILKVLDAERIPYTPARTGPASSGILFLIPALAALAAALCLLLTSFGKKAAPAAGAAAAGRAPQAVPGRAPAAPNAGKQPMLCGIAGPFAGQTFPVTRPLALGRDASAVQVVFAKDAPGISGRHCTVSWDPVQNAFILTDNGSSYGTFLSDGKKLADGVPVTLQPGGEFYLANRGIRFSAELR